MGTTQNITLWETRINRVTVWRVALKDLFISVFLPDKKYFTTSKLYLKLRQRYNVTSSYQEVQHATLCGIHWKYQMQLPWFHRKHQEIDNRHILRWQFWASAVDLPLFYLIQATSHAKYKIHFVESFVFVDWLYIKITNYLQRERFFKTRLNV